MVDDDRDWRLRAELKTEDKRSLLERVIGASREPDVVKEIDVEAPHDLVITHDGNHLFAYAATQASLDLGRRAIEEVLRREAIDASIIVSHWDERFDEWIQVDPPLTEEAKRAEEARERDEEKVESRTMVASTGKLIRTEVEQTMRECADTLGLELETHEHPHVLTTQVAFTVTGPRRKIDEFASGLRAEELATMRTEREVMLSPL